MLQEVNANSFDLAFNRFIQDGFFELSNSSLHLGQLNQLQEYISGERNPEIPYYQFHLNNVYLIPHYVFEDVIAGAITEHEHVVGNDHRDRHVDAHLVRMLAPSNNFNLGLPITNQITDFNSQKNHFERTLFYLLTVPATWNEIDLNGAYFSNENKDLPLSFNFGNNLLKKLEKDETILEKLSLVGIDFRQNILIETLERASALEFLGLKIDWQHDDEFHWLVPELAKHPSLVTLDLGNIPLERTSYNSLISLLSRNYRINRIRFRKPVAEKFIGLEATHEAIRQRLAGDREGQFKSEQLNENKLVSLAEEAIQFNHVEYLQVVLSYQLDLGSITAADKDNNKEIWIQRACSILPEVYKNHPEYLQEASSLVALDLSKVYKETNKTIGYYLLEKAFRVKSAGSIQLLLQAGANIFETPKDQKIFLLKRLFDGNECPPWKEAVIEHIQQNLSILAPNISKLHNFFDLYVTFNNIKKHFDNYLDKLKTRMTHPVYIQVITGVHAFLEERYEQYIKSLHRLVDSITAVTTKGLNEEGNIAYDSMVKLMQYTKEMIEDAKKASRGVLNRSEFNDGLIRLGEELHYEIDRCKDILHHRELAMAKAAAPHLEETILVATKAHKEKKKEQGGQLNIQMEKNNVLRAQLSEQITENNFLREQANAQEAEIKKLNELMKQFLPQQKVNPAQKETTRAGPSLFRR
ncbi:hypothetical protein [Rickettsiella endosymbiont of Aleochara curtula]|uniref:hypothetical protein n=1 Tax=Rickettsiella endosymbiont of Aleochara curtula TaxID=3077936 RepID=UPI00313EE460